MRCVRCVMDDSVPNITFNEKGVCNFCEMHDKWSLEYPINSTKLQTMISDIKHAGQGNRYDCIVGISGGADSSYLLYMAKNVWGLRPLAFHFDNKWNTQISKDNMEKMISALDVDHYTLSVEKAEFDDFCASFLKASVTDADIPNDIGMTAAFYEVADKFNVQNVLTGHSFRTEGSMPLGWTYMDGKYVQSVTEKLGTHKIDTFPNLWIKDWLYWIAVKKIRVLRPFWYMDYDPNLAKKFLYDNYGWQWYKTKHGENKYTKFIAYYYLYHKFGIDKRLVRLSAPVRSGFLSRDDAIEQLSHEPVVEDEIIDEVKERLYLSNEDFAKIMSAQKKTYKDYETYHEIFRMYKPFFWVLCKADLIPVTFYKKYVEV